MKEKHITEILEQSPLASLSEAELALVRAHAAECPECRRAYEASQLSSALLRERAGEVFEPPPFFQTRVLAALRERRAAEETNVFARLWKATGALVASMAATVAMLAVLTFVVPSTQPADTSAEYATAASTYSADELLLNGSDVTNDRLTDEQVLTTLYEPDEGAGR
ncbi:MAG: zf-HC2 domain-containing protein [Acidobacteria bacterium]|nr:zf-HC2 domain-containing protein [Acidobacteriota bacterium]